MSNGIKTIVACGNDIFRYGVCSILTEDGGFDICSDVDNGALILSAYDDIQPELCIISMNMPEMEGLIIARKIMERDPDAQVLLFADDHEHKTLNEFLDSGALGLLHKSAHHIELIDAAEKVSNGERFLGKQFSRMMTQEYLKLKKQKRRPQPASRITKREREVLELLMEGLTSSEIAAKLFISPRTVEKHRTNILKKTGLKNTAALVRFAMENESLLF